MSASLPPNFIQDIQYNCDISDARDHGIYSMCTLVLKLRNLYKWEQGLEPWEEPEPAYLLDWIEAKENYWAAIAEEPYRPLFAGGTNHEPLDLEGVNGALDNNLVYGAGYGRSLKTVFFLAERLEQRRVEDCPVLILGRERAREMASPFAMTQDGLIIIRTAPLRFFLWDQIQELRSTCRSSFQHALLVHGLLRDGALDQEMLKTKLDAIAADEMNLFIYHEVGEILQDAFDSATLRAIVGRFPGSVIEFVGRALKDVLADTHPRGLLAYVVRERRESSLGFYLGFLDGLRQKLFPEIVSAWERFAADADWAHIDQARHACWERNLRLAREAATIARSIGDVTDEQILTRFEDKILAPLGLQRPGNS